MIAIDTSALMAIVLKEPKANDCLVAMETEDDIVVSAGTILEAMIVAARRNVVEEMERLIEALSLEVIAVTPSSARRAANAYQKWGKGFHSAGLNFGDCFAYELAKERRCPLLFIGDDFAQTDLESAIPANL